MRDPKRIKRIVSLIENIWHKYPDLRLGQMLINAINLDYETDDEILEKELKEYYGTKVPKV